MIRHFTAAALLCGSTLTGIVAPILAASGDSPAFQLVANGIAGGGNYVEPGPSGDVRAGDVALTFQKASLMDVITKLGGTMHIAGAFGVAWVCYVSPDATPTTIWFAATHTNDGTFPLSGVALETVPPAESAGCTALEAPLAITTNAPGLGATMAELEATFGAGPDVEADGTIAYFFGAENQPDGINALTKERKYRVIGGKVVAASAGLFYELQ